MFSKTSLAIYLFIILASNNALGATAVKNLIDTDYLAMLKSTPEWKMLAKVSGVEASLKQNPKALKDLVINNHQNFKNEKIDLIKTNVGLFIDHIEANGHFSLLSDQRKLLVKSLMTVIKK